MSERELRTAAQPMEIREDEGDAIRVSGYAAVFGEETNIGGMFTEVIDRGAFANALQRQDDVVFLVNHDGLAVGTHAVGNVEADRGRTAACIWKQNWTAQIQMCAQSFQR